MGASKATSRTIHNIATIVEMIVGNFTSEMIGGFVVLFVVETAWIILYADLLEAGTLQLYVEPSRCNLYSHVLVAYNRNLFSNQHGIWYPMVS